MCRDLFDYTSHDILDRQQNRSDFATNTQGRIEHQQHSYCFVIFWCFMLCLLFDMRLQIDSALCARFAENKNCCAHERAVLFDQGSSFVRGLSPLDQNKSEDHSTYHDKAVGMLAWACALAEGYPLDLTRTIRTTWAVAGLS